MTNQRPPQQSRSEIVARLAEAPRVTAVDRWLISPWSWLVLALIWVGIVGWLLGPIRHDSHHQLFTAPRFGAEILLGVFSVVTATSLAFRLARPAAVRSLDVVLTTLTVTAWLATLFLTLIDPAIAPSMAGKRPSCEWEAFALSLPPALLGIVMLRRGFVTQPWRAGLLLAFAAGVLPAVFMQLACMLDPAHMLNHHLLPAAVVTVVMGALGAWAVKPR